MHPKFAPSSDLWGNTPTKITNRKCKTPDMFQAKMSDLIGSLEFVQAYIDNLFYMSKGSLEDHLEKLDEVLK
jgi:hypothetical protein